MTVFENKQRGSFLNIEIERGTQVVVDTVRDAVETSLCKLKPVLDAILLERGVSLEEMVHPPSIR